MTKYDWSMPYIKLAVRPLDWFKLNFRWFRHGRACFLRIGPIDFSFSWYIEERPEGCK